MADLRLDRLAAELRDVLDELDDLHDIASELADGAWIAAAKAEAIGAPKATVGIANNIAINNERIARSLDEASARLRDIVVRRLDSAERLEGGGT